MQLQNSLIENQYRSNQQTLLSMERVVSENEALRKQV